MPPEGGACICTTRASACRRSGATRHDAALRSGPRPRGARAALGSERAMSTSRARQASSTRARVGFFPTACHGALSPEVGTALVGPLESRSFPDVGLTI